MAAESGLDGWRVLVTRPVGREEALIEALQQCGAKVDFCPVQRIVPIENEALLFDVMADAEVAVFVSIHAVDAVARVAGKRGFGQWSDCRFAAVGPGTAGALEGCSAKVHFQPVTGGGSEALVDAMAGNHFGHKRVVIFAAQRGRQLLADWFIDQGADVETVVSYRRETNFAADPALLTAFLAIDQRLVILSSEETADALIELAGEQQQPALFSSRVVVISDRVAAFCESRGFSRSPTVATTPDVASLVLAAVDSARDGVQL